jgi:hypothetical protein
MSVLTIPRFNSEIGPDASPAMDRDGFLTIGSDSNEGLDESGAWPKVRECGGGRLRKAGAAPS